MRLGFIGVGTIAEALITGMMQAGGKRRASFVLSPRNVGISRRLAARFSFIQQAVDNQAVIDGSDVVFLAVRPQVAADVLGALEFRSDQRIVSLIATFDVVRLRALVKPAYQITRLAPLPSVARCLGPLTLYPPTPEIAELLTGLGQLIQAHSEADLDAFWAATGLMGSYFGLLDEIAGWLERQNLPSDQVLPFVASMFEGLAATGTERAMGRGFNQLVAEHSTAGGLNEQAFRELRAAGWTSLVSQTLDLIHARVLGKATFADRLETYRSTDSR